MIIWLVGQNLSSHFQANSDTIVQSYRWSLVACVPTNYHRNYSKCPRTAFPRNVPTKVSPGTALERERERDFSDTMDKCSPNGRASHVTPAVRPSCDISPTHSSSRHYNAPKTHATGKLANGITHTAICKHM